MNLKSYPRPQNDNGIGLHFRLDVTQTPNKPYISQGVEWLQIIHAKWALVPGQDWMQLGKAASMIWAAGIMPVCRLVCKIDKPFIDWENGVKTLKDAGIPPYFQIFNEPDNDREWNSHPSSERFGEKWADAAARVLDAGGYPGMAGVLNKEDWVAAFNAVQASGRTDIWQRAWWSLHNYGSNHPPSYPYDDVNQNGTPVSQAEYDALNFSLPRDKVNALRQSSAHPGHTALDDDTCALRFIEFKAWMIESLGFCLPMIGGEGGWEFGNEEDHRYSKLTPKQHADFHREMFEWFKSGVLSNGDPLPDELFSIAPWIQADGGADDWWFGPLGTKQLTIDTVASIATFTRKFSWDQATLPAQPTDGGATSIEAPTIPPTMPTSEEPAATSTPTATAPTATTPTAPTTDGAITYVVQHGETLWGIAKKFGTTVAALAAANNIADPSKIRAGQTLKIPR